MNAAFPGTTIRRNSPLSDAVRAIQTRLVALGCGPVEVDGLYGKGTEAAVKLFQSRFQAPGGGALKADGEVGPMTWTALFGEGTVAAPAEGGALARAALAVAIGKIGVREDPPGSNRGAQVETFLRAVDVAPGNPWCAAFIYWCVAQAAATLGGSIGLRKTGSVLAMWRGAKSDGLPCLTAAAAAAQPSLISTGMIFFIDHGGGLGHAGFVESAANGRLITVEGNSNDGGSREGIGVFRLARRTISSINLGFVALP